MGQKVLVIGSGAREHTIAYTLLKAPSIDEVTVAPGNPGMLKDGIHTTQLSQSNHAALIEFVKNNGYDWVFVGPEVPLIEGIVDDFAAAGIKAFGPSKAAAQIEGSKDFAKQLMDRHNIPTAQYKTFSDLEMAQDYVHEHGAPIVIKADGLAAGKGVTVAMDEHTAQRALAELERRELCRTERTAGRFITDSAERVDALRIELAQLSADDYIRAARGLGLTHEQAQQLITSSWHSYDLNPEGR